MYSDFQDLFYKRLTQLRIQKGASARGMSADLGQSNSYITRIESKKGFPSMEVFFYICDYFRITPKEFFDDSINSPVELQEALTALKPLSKEQLAHIIAIAKDMRK